MAPVFPDIRFRGTLRPSQAAASSVIRRQLDAGERRLHVVAPPGSGKTVLGLYVWAHLVQRPVVVFSPTSAIQSQWAARLDLFSVDDPDHVSTDPHAPALFNSFTYQALTRPGTGGADLDDAAVDRWRERLIESGEANDDDEAIAWIEDLRQRNPSYFETRLATYRKSARDDRARGGGAMDTLDDRTRLALVALRERGVGLLIFDECHHLLGHWGRVLAEVADMLDDPVVLGLTATPPDMRGIHADDAARYGTFFGDVDYEVPVPALVRDRNLAPYQDLAYIVRPEPEEVRYLSETDAAFNTIVAELESPRETDDRDDDGDGADDAAPARVAPMPEWIASQLASYRIVDQPQKDWTTFVRRDRGLADLGRLYLHRRAEALPEGVPPIPPLLLAQDVPRLEGLVTVLDRYIRHGLRRSAHEADRDLANRAIARLRLLGLQVTETGTQACAAPVTRVLAYAKAKTRALVTVLRAESAVLGDALRAVVVCDYEKTSTRVAELKGVLDPDAGAAIAAFRAICADDVTDILNPILVTGSTVLVDDDLVDRFVTEATAWIAEHGFDVALETDAEDGFSVVRGRGGQWTPRLYVRLITELFQRGVTRCLVGTRGLLGEGWDANKINVLVDLTTATTSVTVNQLRGRSIRLDPDDPEKIADNWDIICVAGEFTKGLDDYRRFMDKHRTLYGATDDGAIERGVGHVHAAFTAMQPEDVEGAMPLINEEMLSRVGRRAEGRERWKLGTPFRGETQRTLEVKLARAPTAQEFPAFGGTQPWNEHTLVQAIARATLDALREAQLIAPGGTLGSGVRSGGYVRVFLDRASEADAALLVESIEETLAPLERPRYVIPRFVAIERDTWMSRILPDIIGRYLRKRTRQWAMLHAVPSALAKHKDLVAIFQRAWNRHVSPGEAVYAHHGKGETLLERARQQGLEPAARLHDKDVFV
ncbi:MAG: DEAD/DEAH box helicase family protein [Phycisphaerales bacterium]|nr:DEAD/DEAH box helicase family protein [Phycisphaerales bacterium]